MNILQLFCRHKYNTHVKEETSYVIESMVEDKHCSRPVVQKRLAKETIETLVCNKCGNIREIYY